ncbi:retrovirus-related pol polyprotein from transposon TNT 1-94 [Tanacetum coccineum]
MCSYLRSLSDLDAHTELQCLYLHKVKEYECLAQKLSKQTKTVSKEVYNELSQSFAKLEKHTISLELALQQCQEQMKNDTVCIEKASNVFLKEREQYHEIQDLKAQLQDKNIAINLQGNDLLTGNRGNDLYTNSLQESTSSTPIYFMAKASPTQAWLWHQRLSHLNFDYINLLSKKDIVIGLPKLKYVKDQLCSSYEYGVVERRNRTLVEAARTMLSASKLPLFFWTEVIATACYTQNISIIIPTYEKTAYHIINDKKPLIRHLHIFGCTCYLTRDGENLDKIEEKGDPCILGDTQLSRMDIESLSQQELDLLFGPLYDEFFTACTSSVNKSSSPTDNSTQQDIQPTANIYPSSEPITPTKTVTAEENNTDDQAEI